MATTLSKGYIKPANPDTGDVFWNALAADIQLMNDHVHDGVTGAILPAVSQSILAANWTAVSGQPGTYSQVVTLPSALAFGTIQMNFRLTNGTYINPTITQVSSSQYTIFINDNTQALTAVYSS